MRELAVNIEGISFGGFSVAGISTFITLPELDITFDVAQGFPEVMSINNILITHAHQDHAAGIPYIIAQKMLMGMKTPKFYMPSVMIEPMQTILREWQKLEGFEYRYELLAAEHGMDYQISKNIYMRPFATVHRVPTNGYTLFEKKKKLKPAFQDAPPADIIEAKKKGTAVEDYFDVPLVSFTGDTQIEFLDTIEEFALQAKVFIVEATYLDDRKSVEQTKKWGHTHLDEIVERLDRFQCNQLLINHISARYSIKEQHKILRAKMDAKVPENWKNRIQFFNTRNNFSSSRDQSD